MDIRFCEFCSTVHPDDATHCPNCGTRLVQSVSEEYFNDPENPWPFVPISQIHVALQGTPRLICFSGTHSVFHLLTELHEAYSRSALYCRVKGEELELVHDPKGCPSEEYRLLDPVVIMGCQHNRFSVYSTQEEDPDVSATVAEDALERTYHGSFTFEDCPVKFRRDLLGWMVAAEPRPALEAQWSYVIS